MKRTILAASLIVLAASLLPVHRADAQDNESTQPRGGSGNGFFIDSNLGKTEYRANLSHNHSVFQNIRFGWRWDGHIGPELGYVYLGRPKNFFSPEVVTYNAYSVTGIRSSAETYGATLGINGKYDFLDNWFVTAHGGYLRSRSTYDVTHYSAVGAYSSRYRSWNNGWYAGLGVGYNITSNVSIGINYDNYRVDYSHDGNGNDRVNVAAFSGSLEYRF